jgi:Primase X
MTQCHNRILAYSLNLNKTIEIETQEGFDYLLSHFSGPSEDIFPRTIATKITEGRQVLVSNRQEALTWFGAANWLDCRISAYRYWKPSALSKFIGIINPIPPDLVLIDLDMCNFDDESLLKTALRKVLLKITRLLGVKPTVIWSGNGYHIYVPINDPIVLEDIKEFAHIKQVSTKFLRFAEWYLSSGLSDSVHNKSVSLNNCMLRIPGSINSKNGIQVKVVKKWDGNRPHIKLLIGSFCSYLREQEIKELQLQHKRQTSCPSKQCGNNIQWIETLLQTPLADCRKFAIWRILAPYLINVKMMSRDDAFATIENWLNECDKLNRLSFYPKARIREGLRGALKGYHPISFEKLQTENRGLYERLLIKR